jgi:uncharacterized protein
MEEKLVEFANLLRQNGLRVSVAEVLDAFNASDLTGLGERDIFRSALRATMVKRASEVPVFDELFDLYFSGLGEIIKQAGQGVQDALSMSDEEFQQFLEQMEEMLKNQGKELSELAKALLSNNNGQLEKMLREAARNARLGNIERTIEEAYFARALARELGLDRLERELEEFREHLDKGEHGQRARMEEFLQRRLQALQDIIRRYVRVEREKRDLKTRESDRMQQLSEKSFLYLTPQEIEKMNEAIARLAQRLKNIIAVRRRLAKKGRFDIKKTLRTNLVYGGVPFKLRFDRRKKEKPQVVILCDVSDSVRNVSRFMLQFVYSLQDLYSKVRSFIFVAEIGEITEHFRDNDIKDALDIALRGDLINVYAHSNFGYAFRTFTQDYIGAVNKKTTVIVLGDGRNNYNLPHDWCLREIRGRAKQLIWLNPESKNTWGFGDSEMERYGPHCDMVEECRNLNQLYHVIDRLVPR